MDLKLNIMKVEELRIGNLVAINNEKHYPKMKGIPLVVVGIEKLCSDEDSFVMINYINEKENMVIPAFSQIDKFIEPIELSQEIMLNFGFVEFFHGTYSTWCLGDSFSLDQDSEGFTFQNHGGWLELKYAHQLQNLYFALTGEELKFKNDEKK